MKEKAPEKRKRGLPLAAFLILVMTAGLCGLAVGVIVMFVEQDVLQFYELVILVVSAFFALFFAAALWKWKKFGFYGLFLLGVLSGIYEATDGTAIREILGYAAWVAVLCAVALPKWGYLE